MDLSYLTDKALHEQTHNLFKQEKKLLIQIIHHLRENEKRRLFSLYKYESLQDYLVFEFALSEDAAWRRIDAIKLLEDLPELEDKLMEYKHSLTNLNLAHSLFKKEAEFAEAFTKQEKLDILEYIEHLPSRAVKKILLGYSSVPHEMVKEPRNAISMDLLESNDKIWGKLKKIQGLLAHTDKAISMIDVVDKLCDLGIEKWDPAKKKTRTTNKVQTSAAPRVQARKSTHIPKQIYLSVWQRAESQCENCGSTYALQIEHNHPKALGGSDDLENLKLLCRSCNQRSAIEAYGKEKIWLMAQKSMDS